MYWLRSRKNDIKNDIHAIIMTQLFLFHEVGGILILVHYKCLL